MARPAFFFIIFLDFFERACAFALLGRLLGQ